MSIFLDRGMSIPYKGGNNSKKERKMSITTMIDYEDAKRSKPFPKLMENTMNKDIALFTKE